MMWKKQDVETGQCLYLWFALPRLKNLLLSSGLLWHCPATILLLRCCSFSNHACVSRGAEPQELLNPNPTITDTRPRTSSLPYLTTHTYIHEATQHGTEKKRLVSHRALTDTNDMWVVGSMTKGCIIRPLIGYAPLPFELSRMMLMP